MTANRPVINKTLISNAEPRDKRYFIWDVKPQGFGLVVQPSGSKAYVYQYRTIGGRTRRGTIGRVEKFTPDQARRKAKEWQEMVSKGEDPVEAKRKARNELTVSALLDEYVASDVFKEKAASTKRLIKVESEII